MRGALSRDARAVIAAGLHRLPNRAAERSYPHAQAVPFSAPADSLSGGAAHPARILIVEDDYFVALEMENHLLDAGYDVVGIASTAEDAFSLAAAKKPDLAIMDIRLAGVRDGIDTAIELSSKLGLPSIFATAHADDRSKRRAEAAKPLGWLHKPYSAQALIALVTAALNRSRRS
jgi:two-component system, response regulator PdtaR